jgi:hypothetical protein
MIKFKRGVTIFGIKPEMIVALMVVEGVYADILNKDVTVTAVTDGTHTSIVHYLGYGVDVRTRDDNSSKQWSDEVKQELCKCLKERLPKGFDIVIHSSHFHLEYDPR